MYLTISSECVSRYQTTDLMPAPQIFSKKNTTKISMISTITRRISKDYQAVTGTTTLQMDFKARVLTVKRLVLKQIVTTLQLRILSQMTSLAIDFYSIQLSL